MTYDLQDASLLALCCVFQIFAHVFSRIVNVLARVAKSFVRSGIKGVFDSVFLVDVCWLLLTSRKRNERGCDQEKMS
jgi:hypothetical protein